MLCIFCTYSYNAQEYHYCPYNPVIQRIVHTRTILNVVGDSCPREATYCHSGTAVLPEQRQHVPKALFSRETGTVNTRIFRPTMHREGCKVFFREQSTDDREQSTENRVQMALDWTDLHWWCIISLHIVKAAEVIRGQKHILHFMSL